MPLDKSYLTPGVVGISGVMPLTEEASGYPALVSTQHWNGWMIPYFDRATVDRIVADTAVLLAEHGPDTVEDVVWSGDNVLITSARGTEDEYAETLEPLDLDGTQYWCVGGMAWTWEDWS